MCFYRLSYQGDMISTRFSVRQRVDNMLAHKNVQKIQSAPLELTFQVDRSTLNCMQWCGFESVPDMTTRGHFTPQAWVPWLSSNLPILLQVWPQEMQQPTLRPNLPIRPPIHHPPFLRGTSSLRRRSSRHFRGRSLLQSRPSRGQRSLRPREMAVLCNHRCVHTKPDIKSPLL